MTMILHNKIRIFLFDGVNQAPDACGTSHTGHILDAEDDFVRSGAQVNNIIYASQIVFVGGPVRLGEGDRRLKEPSSLHHHLGNRPHIPDVVQEGEASPDVYVYFLHHIFDDVFRVGAVSPEVRFPDKRLKQHTRHCFPEDFNLLERALPSVHDPYMPSCTSVTL